MTRRKLLGCCWLLLIVICLFLYFCIVPSGGVGGLRELVSAYYYPVLIIYTAILSVRGLTLLPSTPFLIGGILLFHPWDVLVANMIGILISASLVYYASSYVGLDEYFQTKFPHHIQKIQKLLENWQIPVISGWSVCPFVHTDLIIYVASTLKVPLRNCLIGVCIGELVINGFYIFAVNSLLGW